MGPDKEERADVQTNAPDKPAKPPRKKKASAQIVAFAPFLQNEGAVYLDTYRIVARGISDKAVLAECAKLKIKAAGLIVAAIHLTGNADIAVVPAVETWQFKKAKA